MENSTEHISLDNVKVEKTEEPPLDCLQQNFSIPKNKIVLTKNGKCKNEIVPIDTKSEIKNIHKNTSSSKGPSLLGTDFTQRKNVHETSNDFMNIKNVIQSEDESIQRKVFPTVWNLRDPIIVRRTKQHWEKFNATKLGRFCKKCFLPTKQRQEHRCGKYYQTCWLCGMFFFHYLQFSDHLFIYHFLKKSVNCGFFRSKISITREKNNCTETMQLQNAINLKTLLNNRHIQKSLKNKKGNFSKLIQNGNINLKKCMKPHNDEKLFNCEMYSKSFTYRSNLKTHMQIQTDQKPFLCEICLKSFTRIYHLKRHMSIHTGQKPFKCAICTKSFTQNTSLKYHMNIHTGQKPFKCEICSKSFAQNSNLITHIKFHTGQKTFKCEICSKSFTRSPALKIHMIVHTGQKAFNCEICSKSFTVRCSLKRHMKIHTGQKEFKCALCMKSFTQNTTLKDHMNIHTGHKPFKCEICSKSFTQNSTLRSHVKFHTRQKPYM